MSVDLDSRLQLLLVDDQSINNTILGEALKEDYLLEFAGGGEEALRAVRFGPRPDMILLDVMMPKMDGFEVCEKLKDDPDTARIPIVFVTSMDDQINEEHGLELGAVDYISKPISPSVVRVRVKVHLQIQQHREFLERLLERRPDDLETAQEEARRLLGLVSPSL